jgi:hypothetical protein
MATSYLKYNPSLPHGSPVQQITTAGENYVDLLAKWVATYANMIDGGFPASGDNTKFAMLASELGTGEAGPNYPIAKGIFDQLNAMYSGMSVAAETGQFAVVKTAANLLR